MTINHIDQLAEWWEGADNDTVTHPGDTIIQKNRAGFDVFEVAHEDTGVHISSLPRCRILARAPKPKPAWHDAVAVMADDGDGDRMVWVRADEQGKSWESADGFIRHPSELNSPTPLIEAKVTDEMVQRARHRADSLAAAFIYSASEWHMREVLTAALGIEAE